jgi:prepilin-type N-terminal cleavage/methylation domain-containing protein
MRIVYNLRNKSVIAHESNNGFTLLEMVASMVILGVLASAVAIGMAQAAKGFITVQGTQAVVEGAELGMLRLSKELLASQQSSIVGSASSLQFASPHTGSSSTYTASLSNSQLILTDNSSHNYVLANNVSSLSFAYYDTYNGTAKTTWSATSNIINISLTFSGPNNTSLTFTTSVMPRN